MATKIQHWFGSNWFPVMTVIGFMFHATYTVAITKEQFEDTKRRISALEVVKESVYKIGTLENSVLDVRAELIRIRQKQEEIDSKINKLIGAMSIKGVSIGKI